MSPRKKRRKRRAVKYLFIGLGLAAAIAVPVLLVWLIASKLATPWQPFNVPGGGCVVELPGPVSKNETVQLPSAIGPVKAAFALCELESSKEVYIVMVVDAPVDRIRSADARTLLQDACNGMVQRAQGADLRSNTDIDYRGFPGKELVLEVPNRVTGVSRLFLIGRRMVGLLVAGPDVRPNASRVTHFINSFRITDEKLTEAGRKDLASMAQVGTDGAGRRVYDYNGNPVPAATDIPGLILYLPFDEPGPGDQVIDAVTKKPAARLCGGAAYGKGVRGKGLDLTGKGRYLDYSQSGDRLNFKADAPFTFALWVRTPAPASWGTLFSQRAAKAPGGLVQIGWAGTGFLSPLAVRDGARNSERASIVGPQLKVPFWNHVALTRQADGEFTLFLTGAPLGKGPGPREAGPITTAVRVLGIASDHALQGFREQTFSGEMDEFCVFDRALTADEIKKLAGVE